MAVLFGVLDRRTLDFIALESGQLTLDRPTDLRACTPVMENLRSVALSPDVSRDRIDQGVCVEVALHGPDIRVRDSKDATGPALRFSPAAWAAFTAAPLVVPVAPAARHAGLMPL